MTITYTDASIFDLDVEALVNPVNCVGVSARDLRESSLAAFLHAVPLRSFVSTRDKSPGRIHPLCHSRIFNLSNIR